MKLINVANLRDGEVDLSTSSRYISEEEAFGKYSHFLVDAGDFIIASSGIKVDYFDKKMGFIKHSHLPLCMNTSTIRFKPLHDDNLNMIYFMCYMKSFSFKQQLYKQITGSAQLNFGPSHLKQMQLPLPPLDEQKRIAKNLDLVSEIVKGYKEQLSELGKLVQSVFYEMFGDPVTNEKGWDLSKLSALGELNRGVSKHRPRNAPELLGGNYPLIQTGEVSNSGLYITKYSNTYSDIGLNQSRLWNAGTLCITIAANIAQTSILAFDACFPDSVVGFISGERTNQFFIHTWFGFFQRILEEQAPQVAQKNINLRILGALDVIVPPLPIQTRFASIVTEIEAQKTQVQQALTEAENLFNSLMQEYFE